MNIESAQYSKNPTNDKITSIKAIIDKVECWIPIDPNNRHYAEILKQVEEKKLTIKEAEE
tara:strand:+ start:1168 stop:1347 length:180 start_codon:yes stop_codon:yes gene_type:complete